MTRGAEHGVTQAVVGSPSITSRAPAGVLVKLTSIADGVDVRGFVEGVCGTGGFGVDWATGGVVLVGLGVKFLVAGL